MSRLVVCCLWLALAASPAAAADGQVLKKVFRPSAEGPNLVAADRFTPLEAGCDRRGGEIVCDNGGDAAARRGAFQRVTLDQTRPLPIVAAAESRAEGVSGGCDPGYSLYLDLVYTDGSTLWGQSAWFSPGTHDWEPRSVLVLPEKPVRSVSVYVLLRARAGKAVFRNVQLRTVSTDAAIFDGVPVVCQGPAAAGFQVRDVAAESDFVRIDKQALGLKLECDTSTAGGATFFDVVLSDTTGRDRAVTLLYVVPVEAEVWFDDPRQSQPARRGRELMGAATFDVGANGRLSRYPLGCVTAGGEGTALGIDMLRPAFFRIGYNGDTRELFLAYDIGLAAEKPSARVRFCRYGFEAAWGFRAALARFYALFPEQFRCRTPVQGMWMPFAKISRVKGWEDFGFKFKEGHDETKWDDEHGITTFRYTEPMTWWMRMPKEMPRTMAAARAEAERLAGQKNPAALAWRTSGYHDAAGEMPARLLDTPWCDGAVWSMNSMPGIAGQSTDFKLKWNAKIRELYGPERKGDLDGEYIDSAEGYATDELDYRRDHFAAADTPLAFGRANRRPAIFRGLVAFEYCRGLARDVHAMDKLMMANGAPTRVCWLNPLLDVSGTETDWHRQGRWRPMPTAEMLYRRAMCKGRPFCFLMNTDFDAFGDELVEKYMKRSLAYGMFPGFFSHNASHGHYFTRPELYDRQRPLFKKYVPLCKRVAEAGWEPLTLARSSDAAVHVERFGRYLTVFNESDAPRRATIRLERPLSAATAELVGGGTVAWKDGAAEFSLGGEDVAVVDLP